jgi:hypothetical protein
LISGKLVIKKSGKLGPQGGAKPRFSKPKTKIENSVDWSKAFLPPADASFIRIPVCCALSRPMVGQAQTGFSDAFLTPLENLLLSNGKDSFHPQALHRPAFRGIQGKQRGFLTG